ncbi:MAG: sigma-70 family RNA polymerase sigma factor [Phycisphaerales bacterium]|nr:MAG: sigma-70 family RNA polymerase sigma factor [Phycisphaerales bacterium]
MFDAALVTTTLLLSRLHDSRDDLAWAEFDERFRGVIVATARRVGLSPQDAEDAAQETMLCAIRDYQAGKYDRSRGRLSSWIVGIARYRIVDIQRARRHTLGLGFEQSDAPETEVIAEAFERALERHVFERAWARLREQGEVAPQTLLAFELTALRGVPATAAAQTCGMTVDQVYVARHRVARKLSELVTAIDRACRDGL